MDKFPNYKEMNNEYMQSVDKIQIKNDQNLVILTLKYL